jgi:hypothetical protein
MKKTFNLYCDESTHLENDGMPYMLISYISCPYNQMKPHKEYIQQLKLEHNFKGEIKWSNVSNSQLHFYLNLINYFFSTDLSFRTIIVNKAQVVEGGDYNDFYFKMYYQLLHHKIDLENKYNIYLDIKDTRSNKKLHKLRQILSHNASINNLQFIHSYESYFMQMTDLLMGAINYRLRGLDKVIAKNKIIEKIERQCKLPLTYSTPKNEDKFNLFFIDLK